MLQMKSRDRHKWKQDSRTNWRGFRTIRYHDYAGGYSCPNILCLYFKGFEKLNELNFDRENRCKFCSAAGIHLQCDAWKHVAYTENQTEIFIYHYGQHSFKAKHLNKRPKSEVSKAISVNSSVKPSQIHSNNIVSAIRNKRPWTEVEKVVKSFASIKNI